MRTPLLLRAILLSFALCNGSAAAEEHSVYEATVAEANQRTAEVSTEQVRQFLTNGGVVIVDARPRVEYVAGHIPGAVGFDGSASDQVAAVERLVGGDKSRALVLYCNGPFCIQSKRLADRLVDAGFSNVRRYQLGMPIWRALGGPTQVELEGIVRIFGVDRTAVFFDARSPEAFAEGSVRGAHNVTAEMLAARGVQGIPLPTDDFNRRIVVFGTEAGEARALADGLSKRPWHNVAYYSGSMKR